jgi:Rad3-related DNA helicase
LSLELRFYDGSGPLPPRRYSTGKTQLDLIREILDAFKNSDLVLLRGMVGSGKSIVGIRTILEFGKGVVSVPTKVLSDQYARAYERDKYFLKEDGSKAKIGILKGRRNFVCPYARRRGHETTCADKSLPCRRPLDRESGEHRIDALREDPFWGFIFPAEVADRIRDVKKYPYEGITGKWTLCERGKCPYWEQFGAYHDSDVIVMNSMKWAAEVAIGRLPRVPMVVVDEADDWLDSLALKVSVTDKRIDVLGGKIQDEESLEELSGIWEGTLSGERDPLELAIYLTTLMEETDETSTDFFWKLKSVLEEWAHVECEVRENTVLYLVPDPQPVLQKFFRKLGGKWLLMSATVQSQEVLREVFGIEPVLVEGETRFPGKLIQRRLGREKAVNYKRWSDGNFRLGYWDFLSEIMRMAKRPSFLPVHAFKYLPPELADKIASEKTDVIEEEGVMITTKMDRGADLKGMGSVIITKFPFPEREDPLLRGMEKRLGKRAFWRYYRDIAERCFVQQIGRVLRSDADVVEFWSPDEICHRMLYRLWKGRVEGGDRCFP